MTLTLPRFPLLLRLLLLNLLLTATLTACSGGISGTGDGDIIVVDGDNVAVDSTDNGVTGGTLESQVAQLQIFPGSILSQPAARTFTNNMESPADGADAQMSTTPTPLVSLELNSLLSSYNNVSAGITTYIALLETNLSDAFNNCENQGVCSTLPATATIAADQNQLVTADNAAKNFFNIQYTRNTAGFFDHMFTYTLDNGTNVTLQWNNAEDLFYFYADSGTTITYSLTDSETNSITLRHTIKNTGALLQATLINNTDTSTSIEADIIDWYIRGTIDTQNTVIYAHDQENPVIRREATATDGTVISAESCDSNNCIWQSVSDENNEIFLAAENKLGNFSETFNLNTETDIPLPPQLQALPERWVVSTEDNNGTALQQSIVCSGVAVANRQRVFCWQPTPLSARDYFFYEETPGSGLPSFRQLTTN